MLREIEARQVPGEPPRRWFASPRCDLIVWLRDDETLQGFQFCYDKEAVEHALTWMEGRGFSHMRVDSGGRVLAHGRGTPLLVEDAVFDAGRILGVFREECALLPAAFAGFVSGKLSELAAGRSPS